MDVAPQELIHQRIVARRLAELNEGTDLFTSDGDFSDDNDDNDNSSVELPFSEQSPDQDESSIAASSTDSTDSTDSTATSTEYDICRADFRSNNSYVIRRSNDNNELWVCILQDCSEDWFIVDYNHEFSPDDAHTFMQSWLASLQRQ